MAIRTHYEQGQFAWVDLTARDMAAAGQFYGKLLGWESVDTELPGGPPYAYFQLDGKRVAGLGQMNDTMLAKNLPAAWNSYIHVDDVRVTCQQVARLGGEVTVPVTQISEAGTLAFIRDPTGAQVGLWQKGTHFGADITQDYHCSCWHELLTRDIETARTFYNQLFGWEFSDYKSSWSKYYVVQHGEEENSGMLQMDERWGDMPPRWMTYFAVRSVDITVDQVRQLGGFVHVHPYDIPEGRFAMVGDAQGAVFDLVEMSENGGKIRMMLSSLLILVGSCLSQTDAPQPPDTAAQVAKLARQLDDDQWARRQSAEAELIKMGPGILELLPPAEARMSPELKERLSRVRSQLQVEYARQVVEPTRVTLQGTISLAEALRTIQQATGNQIEGYEDLENERVTVDLSQVPFWEAFDRVLDQVKLAVDPYAGQSGTLRVEPRPDGQIDRFENAYYEGPFRLEATHVTAVRDLRNAAVSGLRVRLSIAWEPKTKPISISVPLSEIVARDNLGRAVPTDHPRGRLTAAIESDLSMIEMELPLKLPPRDAEFIASLQGTFDVMIPGRNEVFKFPELEKAEGRQEKRAGVTVTFDKTRKNDDIDEIILRIEFDEASNALESHRGWILKNGACLIDAAGGRVEYGSYRVINQTENSIQIAYLFALGRPLSDYQFVYETPSLIIRQPMQFALKKIALP